MKFLLYTWYFFRSLVLRGPLNTLKLLATERHNEKRFGISTARIRRSGSTDFYHYQGAGYLVLSRIFNKLGPMPGYSFTDIGCGKGRVLCVAENAGFSRLTGIELEETLLNEAKKNIAVCKTKRTGSEFELVHANALDFNYGKEPCVYFMFNPFSAAVLEGVVHRILSAGSADTWFIYMNPVHREVFSRLAIPPLHAIRSGLYTEALIYRVHGSHTSS